MTRASKCQPPQPGVRQSADTACPAHAGCCCPVRRLKQGPPQNKPGWAAWPTLGYRLSATGQPPAEYYRPVPFGDLEPPAKQEAPTPQPPV